MAPMDQVVESGLAASDTHVDQGVMNEIAQMNSTPSGLDGLPPCLVEASLNNNIQQASQSGYVPNSNRPRAATTMNPIDEEAIDVTSMFATNASSSGLHNHHGEAPLPEQGPNLHFHAAAITGRPTKYQSNLDDEQRIIRPMLDDIAVRSESLIANAAQHEHNQDVPACTDDHHNKNCGSCMDMPLMEYAHLRSIGAIPERPYEHWGCDSQPRKEQYEFYEKCHVRVAFRPVNWESGYTGRGSTKKSIEQPMDIGPRNEIEPTNASPLQLQRLRRQTPKVFQHDKEEGYEPRRPDFLDDDVVGHCGEGLDGHYVGPSGETMPPHGLPSARETSTQDLSVLFAKTARAGLKLLEKETEYDHNQTMSPNPAIGTFETTCSQSNKRMREATEDSDYGGPGLDGSVPRRKRLKTTGSNTEEVLDPNGNRLPHYPYIKPSKRVKDLLNTLTTIRTGAATYDGRTVKMEPNDDSAEGINVRPTYAEGDSEEEEEEEEENEADELVVMGIETVCCWNSRSIRLISHAPREWTDEEKENLRLWVQDYGVTNWRSIAWCLKRKAAECKLMCCYIIMVRNQRAGRDIYDGMREDLLAALPPSASATATPSATPSPSQSTRLSASPTPSPTRTPSPSLTLPSPSPVLLTSPTITTRSLRSHIARTAPRFQCGEILYDVRARSLPKLAKNGNVVDNKGNVVVAWPGEGALASKVQKARRKAVQKSRLTMRPQTGNEPGNAPTMDTETGEAPAAKSYGSGAWRYGASRRAGNRKR